MPRSTQRYSPDTCGCRINQTVDGDASSPVVLLADFELKCPAHRGLDDTNAYAVVLTDQRLKNGFEERLQNLSPHLGLTEEVQQISSDFDVQANAFVVRDGGRRLRPGLEFIWEFDAKRVLSVWVIGQRFTVDQRAALEAVVAELNAGAQRPAVRLRIPSKFVQNTGVR